MMVQKITKQIAKKVITTVDAGLSSGLGKPVPGQMCVEAAVCFALGLPHGDDPGCVSQSLRSLKIGLNDSNWSSNEARARGLRRLSVAQLGSAGVLDEAEFLRRVSELTCGEVIASALEAAASIRPQEKHKLALIAAAKRCREEKSGAAAHAAGAAADAAGAADAADAAAYAAARDKALADYAEKIVQILIAMNAPGVKWLSLT